MHLIFYIFEKMNIKQGTREQVHKKFSYYILNSRYVRCGILLLYRFSKEYWFFWQCRFTHGTCDVSLWGRLVEDSQRPSGGNASGNLHKIKVTPYPKKSFGYSDGCILDQRNYSQIEFNFSFSGEGVASIESWGRDCQAHAHCCGWDSRRDAGCISNRDDTGTCGRKYEPKEEHQFDVTYRGSYSKYKKFNHR
ncbi:hypothetical protein ACQZV8_14665 [Magnetococcales bacterium HHB-1]